jgi:hypothetical protein
MPVRVQVDGLRELRRDLKQIDRTLPRKLNAEIKRGAEPMRAEAARLAPKRTGRLAASLKVGTSGSRVRIYSRRSGASVVHWGGRHPLFGNRNRWYTQQPNPFITRAVAHQAGRLERDIAHAVEALMRNAGFK